MAVRRGINTGGRQRRVALAVAVLLVLGGLAWYEAATRNPVLQALDLSWFVDDLRGDPVVLAAGDIADCWRTGDEATARLLGGMEGTVLTLGDNAYDIGTVEQFRDCYDPTWGKYRERTRPVPGNHDYYEGGGPYYAYFGDLAGPEGKGYYSFDLGTWHIVALNSNIEAKAGSEQERWLRTDLAGDAAECTLAYWHHPVFSSGSHGNDPRMRDAWRALYEDGADVVLAGHDHNYERFSLLDGDGQGGVERGIRQFVVGTGGAGLRGFDKILPASEVRDSDTYGVLRMVLREGGYTWQFISAIDGELGDSGEGRCVP